MAKNPAAAEDVGNIIHFEHLNVTVPDQRLAGLFYVAGLGLTRDPHMQVTDENMWINCGEQQFHLPTRGTQVLPGHINVVMPDLAALQMRLQAVEPKLSGTRFSWSRAADHVMATCPWGNQFRVYEAGTKYAGVHLGVPSLEFDVPQGKAAGIARFYHRVLGAPSTVLRDGDLATAKVFVGAYQHLEFHETFDRLPDYDGHHVAVYIGQVSGAYRFFQKRGIIMEELVAHQFRFKDIIDPDSGEPLIQLEHEVRTLRHPMFKRPLVNRDPTVTMGGYAPGAGAMRV